MANLFSVYVVLSLGFAAAFADNVPIHDCGSVLGNLTKIDISPCPSIPCPFKRGTYVNVTLDFAASASITNATAIVHGIYDGVSVDFPLDDPDACNHMTCPIKPGSTGQYKYSEYVSKIYPSIEVEVKWEIVSDSDKKDVICFTVPVKITS